MNAYLLYSIILTGFGKSYIRRTSIDTIILDFNTFLSSRPILIPNILNFTTPYNFK